MKTNPGLATILTLFSLISIACTSPSTSAQKLGFRLLKTESTAEVIEYEFKDDGRLLAYIYTHDGSESDRNATFEVDPIFQVLHYKWRIEGDKLILLIGRQEMNIPYESWHRDDDTVHFGESQFKKVNNLDFFDNLHEFTNRN